MAYLWHNSNEEPWIPTELTRSAILRNGNIVFVDHPELPSGRAAILLYAQHLDSQPTRWLLLAAPGSRVSLNGELDELVNRDHAG